MPDSRPDAPSVLFVCVKNGGKSQMAAGLMRQLAGDAIAVESAGTQPGHSVNMLSAASLAEVGVDISEQTPKPVTDDLVRAADIVVTLGREAHVDPLPGTSIENWDTDEPSERGIGTLHADAVISATGTWTRPFWPDVPRAVGLPRPAAAHRRPPLPALVHRSARRRGRRRHLRGTAAGRDLDRCHDHWVTPRPPRFLPEDVDGRVLFNAATARASALARGEQDSGGIGGLGDIVMVPSVREARDRGVLYAQAPFERLTHDAGRVGTPRGRLSRPVRE
jgi:arsenate-mycothiol transferase